MYPIKAASSLTGLNSETLRAWERRYGAVTPKRDDNGRRSYSELDIQRLTLLNKATNKGHTISKIARLDKTELESLLKENESDYQFNRDLLLNQVLDALSRYRMDECENLLRRALLAMSPLIYARDFLLPMLHEVGDLWHKNKLTIAQEHMFSNCVKRIVLSMVHNLSPFSGHQHRLLFTTLSGEVHEFGILLSCLIAADQNNVCYYLGPEIPVDELIKVQLQIQADAIVLSLISTPPSASMVEQLTYLSKGLTGQVQVWIGGSGAVSIAEADYFKQRFQLVQDLDHYVNLLNKLNKV